MKPCSAAASLGEFFWRIRLLQAAKPCSSRQNWEGLRRSFCPIRPSHIGEGHTSIAAKSMAQKKQLIPMLDLHVANPGIYMYLRWRHEGRQLQLPESFQQVMIFPVIGLVGQGWSSIRGVVKCLVLLSIAPGLSIYVPKSVPKTHCLMTQSLEETMVVIQEQQSINQSINHSINQSINQFFQVGCLIIVK